MILLVAIFVNQWIWIAETQIWSYYAEKLAMLTMDTVSFIFVYNNNTML